MNDQLQEQVAAILSQLSDSLSTGVDVAIKELPEIAQQYISYGAWKGALGISFSCVFLIVSIVAFFMLLKWARRSSKNCDTYGGQYLFLAFPIVGALFSCGVFYNNLENLILNLNAPELWLLLEIKTMIS